MPGAQRGVVQVAPATGSKGASPRSNTTTAAGGVLHRQGPVQQRLVRHDLPAREPPSVHTITLGAASSMRCARLTEAKPPNTTECTAPMRAQASMVKTASGTMGMYSRTRSPRSTPSSLSMAAAALTSS